MKRQILAMMSCGLMAAIAAPVHAEDSPSIIRDACLTTAEKQYQGDLQACQGTRPDRVQACRARVAATRTRSTLACENQFARTMERMQARAKEQQQRALLRAARP